MHSHGKTCQRKFTLNASYFKVTLIVDQYVSEVLLQVTCNTFSYSKKLSSIIFFFKFLLEGTSEKPPMVDHAYKNLIRFHKEP